MANIWQLYCCGLTDEEIRNILICAGAEAATITRCSGFSGSGALEETAIVTVIDVPVRLVIDLAKCLRDAGDQYEVLIAKIPTTGLYHI